MQGAVTLLFTDIVGSTGLWAAHESAMTRVLEQHDGIVAECVALVALDRAIESEDGAQQ